MLTKFSEALLLRGRDLRAVAALADTSGRGTLGTEPS